MLDLVGWVATAIFVSSYFCKRPAMMRRTQALAALVWIYYGVSIHSWPVIGANVIVAFAATYSSFRAPVIREDQSTSM